MPEYQKRPDDEDAEIGNRLRSLLEQLGIITGDNEFFKGGEKQDLITIGKRLAEYMHDSNVRRVAFLDSSARTAYVCLQEAWRRLYPNEKGPEIYFFNPLGYNSRDSVFDDVKLDGDYYPRLQVIAARQLASERDENPFSVDFDGIMNKLIQSTSRRSEENVHEEFEETYTELVKDKESPLLVFDTCMHTGMSYDLIMENLAKMGFSDVRIGLASNQRNETDATPDFVALDGKANGGCYPFDKESLVKKTFESIKSDRVRTKAEIEKGRRLRETIKKIFDTKWGK